MKLLDSGARRAAFAALSALSVVGCALLASLDEHGVAALATDGAIEASDGSVDGPGTVGLDLRLETHALTVPPRRDASVKFTIKRLADQAAITVKVKGTSNVSAPDVVLQANESEGTLAIKVGGDPLVETARLQVTAQSGNGASAAPQEIVVKIAGAPGTLDVTFGKDGIVEPLVTSNGDAFSYAIALHPDGRIVVGGEASNNNTPSFFALRLQPSGAGDPTFGTGGIAIVPLPSKGTATGVAIDRDGSVVLVGRYSPSATSLAAIARLTPVGVPDTSFGPDGARIDQVDGGTDSRLTGVVLIDGGIVAAGNATLADGEHIAFAQARAGSMTLNAQPIGGTKTETGAAIALTADSRVLIAGTRDTSGPVLSSREAIVLRTNPDGAPEQAFGSKGKVYIPSMVANAVAVAPNGAIVVGGGDYITSTLFTVPRATVARLHADGGLDPTFGTNGISTLDAGSAATGIAVQRDAKVGAVIGITNGLNKPQAAVLRLTAAGTLDVTFGGSGIVPLNDATTTSYAAAIALQADGRILVTGSVLSQALNRVFVARVWP